MIERLSPRDRIALAVGAAVILIVFLWLGVLTPYQEAMSGLDARIASRQRQLEQVRELRQEYLQLQREMAEAQKRLVGPRAGFSLFSFIEEVTGTIGVRENLVSMRPQSSPPQGEYREESVEIRLERIGLDQLVRLLYAIENADVFLNVRTMRVKPRFDNPSQLDTTLTVSYYQKA
jgi:general secretion pathway protein M